jgi:poly(A) polymerase
MSSSDFPDPPGDGSSRTDGGRARRKTRSVSTRPADPPASVAPAASPLPAEPSASSEPGGDPPRKRRSRASRSTGDAGALGGASAIDAREPAVVRPDDELALPKVEARPMPPSHDRDPSAAPARSGAGGYRHRGGAEAHEAERPGSRHAEVRRRVPLDEARIDPDVQKVVRRLVRAGYEAYLVGGCVRDLLLERTPKDFDVATSARPEQVRELFRNSRVIGRRFRLVHVLFQAGKVIEVATFRRKPHEDEPLSPSNDDDPLHEGSNLLIRSDNVFGEADEDARRRDFTINGLFYDLESEEILDWVGGLDDVRARVIDTIGDPVVRFREDPVRILRALKFAGRLDLGIRPATYDAMVQCRDALELAARPRLAEEVLRLMRGGQARRTLFLAWETGVLGVLLPELSALLDDSFAAAPPASSKAVRVAPRSAGERVFRLMEHVDRRHDEGAPLDDTTLWTLLLLEPIKEAVEGARDRASAVGEFLEPLIERLAIPRRFADGIRRVVAVLPRILAGKAGRFARTELFGLAVEVAEAEVHARGLPPETLRPIRAALGALDVAPERAPTHRGTRGSARPRQAIPRP